MLGAPRAVARAGGVLLMLMGSFVVLSPETRAQESRSGQSIEKLFTILQGASEALGAMQGGQPANAPPQASPPSSGGYPPPQAGGYPQQAPSYPSPQAGGYPQQAPGYPPPQAGGYPQQAPSYPPPQAGGYPQQQPAPNYPPQQAGGYPQQPSNTPAGGLQDAAAGIEAIKKVFEQFKRPRAAAPPPQ